jgi:hypothetical protein
MGAFEYYAIFALTTSLTLIYVLFWPAIYQAKLDGVDNDFTNAPIISLVIFFIVNTVLAPVMVWLIFVPSLYKNAELGITRAIREK